MQSTAYYPLTVQIQKPDIGTDFRKLSRTKEPKKSVTDKEKLLSSVLSWYQSLHSFPSKMKDETVFKDSACDINLDRDSKIILGQFCISQYAKLHHTTYHPTKSEDDHKTWTDERISRPVSWNHIRKLRKNIRFLGSVARSRTSLCPI